LRVHARNVVLLGLTSLAVSPATTALASSTGGTAPQVSLASATPSTSTATAGGAAPTAPAVPKPKLRLAPVTAHKASLAYKGPVYEKTATGQVVPYVAPLPPGQIGGPTGGSPAGSTATGKPQLLVPGSIARFANGLAAAPMSAPAAVQEIVWAGNQIIGLPYIFGGGHASFVSPGYDCSGTVSFALHGASLLATPMDSSEFEGWGGGGIGQWVTVFTNPGHAYMTVAGLRLDTSAADDPSNQQGPRWRPLRPANGGFKVRHPVGL
jgi:cell wall-associated NlpC family hydrolase